MSDTWVLIAGVAFATTVFWGGVYLAEHLKAKWRRERIERAINLRDAAPTPELRAAYQTYIDTYKS